ncbi:sensor histidine kinase [Lonsdalea quercina]|uniref:histidine kinase n=1 Tax=Lonsdalea quercina TaxID=71657 RepID=A0A1H4ED23_9GAMM|nr:ATP-binding protein [Lonsdalea quercina]SEA82945.1 PAS fold [Lonsdalea quercina]
MFRHSLESLQQRLLIIASLPSSLTIIVLMIWNDYSGYLIALVALICLTLIGYCSLMTRQVLNFQLTTLTNLIEAITHNDFSLRGKRQKTDSELNGLIDMINKLASSMQKQRLHVKQQQYLVRKVLNNIDVAIVALNSDQEIAFVNETAVSLLGQPAKALKGLALNELSFRSLFELPANSVVEYQFPKRRGRYKIILEKYFEDGKKQQLLFITDVSQLLREEEYRAWRNLLRVMSHEINNTLTPIASLSQMLLSAVPDDGKEENQDLRDGLDIINERALNLKSFVDSYRKLTSLPLPQKAPHNIDSLIRKILTLFEHRQTHIIFSEDVVVSIDAVQIEQMLINILKNADEAMSSPEGAIYLSWRVIDNEFCLKILDEGCGIGNTENIFVPFYSVKKNGSGIGLMLSRQIVESHGGYFSLTNREDRPGCKVTIKFPTE